MREFKRLLQRQPAIGLPVVQQQLIRSGTLMLDHQLVSEFQLMQDTVLHLVRRPIESSQRAVLPPRSSGSSTTNERDGDDASSWVRAPYEPLPLVSHNLPTIDRDVFESNKFFVWCTAHTAPCFTDASTSSRRYQPDEVHSPRCSSEAECLALTRHVSIGFDSEGTPYPHELQPASARPRCRRCKNESVVVHSRSIQWDRVFSGSVMGDCLVCEISGPVIEIAFVCRGELARKVGFSRGLTRSVCRSYSTDGTNVPLPNVHQQATHERLNSVATVAEGVAALARECIMAATTTPLNMDAVHEACLAIEQAAGSVESTPPEVIANAVAAAKSVASKLVPLLRAFDTHPDEPLPDTAIEITQLLAATTACEAAAQAVRSEPVVLSSDSGSADMLQLEFHGCSRARATKPHRLNANGLNRYIEVQPNVRSVMVRNDRLPHIFGSYVVQCPERDCRGILYLPTCRVVGPERYEMLREWSSIEVMLQQGGVLCALPNHQGTPAFLPPIDEPGPCRYCATCKDYFCEEHRQPWRSCLHNMDADGMVRHRIDMALSEGALQQCPNAKCGTFVLRDNATCTAMKCSQCNTPWCYFCGREVLDFRQHNRNWQKDASQCPRFLDEHPQLAGTPIQSLALFHYYKTLRLLREARRAMEVRAPGRFDTIFQSLPAALLTIEAQTSGTESLSTVERATAPQITLEMVQQASNQGEELPPYAMP